MDNTLTYMENIFNRTYDYAEQNEDVEVNDWDETLNTQNNTITVGIRTLTECRDSEVNYYDDGLNSITDFIEDLKELLQIPNINFENDVDVNCDEYDMYTVRHGWLKITI